MVAQLIELAPWLADLLPSFDNAIPKCVRACSQSGVSVAGCFGRHTAFASEPAPKLCSGYAVDLHIDTQGFSNHGKNRRKVIHAGVAAGRKHSVQAFARFGGLFRKAFKAYCGVD